MKNFGNTTANPGIQSLKNAPSHAKHNKLNKINTFAVVVQSLSIVRLFATPWTAAHQASLSITNYQSLLRLMSIESVIPSHHLILCRPLLLLPSFFPSYQGLFQWLLALCIRWPKYWYMYFFIWVSFFSQKPIIVDPKIPHICKHLLGQYMKAHQIQSYPY